MKILTDKSLNEAIELCHENACYRVLIITKYAEDHLRIFDHLSLAGADVTRCLGHPWVKFQNNSVIDMISSAANLRGRRANLVLCDVDVYNDDEEIRYTLPAIEVTNRSFKLFNDGRDIDYKFQGKRSEIGVYDDWMHGEDSEEFIVPSPRVMHDKITAERHSKVIDELNAIGCTSFILSAEEINALIKQDVSNNTGLTEV